jgi:hypothetical protein
MYSYMRDGFIDVGARWGKGTRAHARPPPFEIINGTEEAFTFKDTTSHEGLSTAYSPPTEEAHRTKIKGGQWNLPPIRLS